MSRRVRHHSKSSLWQGWAIILSTVENPVELRSVSACPGWLSWSVLAFVPDCGANQLKHLVHSSWSEQPKVPNCVLITLKNVLGPEVNEFFQGTADLNHLA